MSHSLNKVLGILWDWGPKTVSVCRPDVVLEMRLCRRFADAVTHALSMKALCAIHKNKADGSNTMQGKIPKKEWQEKIS